jgi:hypothetical protein
MTAACSTDPTGNIVQTTSKYLAPKRKLVVRQQILVCDTVPQGTHLVGLLRAFSTDRTPTPNLEGMRHQIVRMRSYATL